MPKNGKKPKWTVILMILAMLAACLFLPACDDDGVKKKPTPTNTPTAVIPETPVPMLPVTPRA
jgi:hypothetical protein